MTTRLKPISPKWKFSNQRKILWRLFFGGCAWCELLGLRNSNLFTRTIHWEVGNSTLVEHFVWPFDFSRTFAANDARKCPRFRKLDNSGKRQKTFSFATLPFQRVNRRVLICWGDNVKLKPMLSSMTLEEWIMVQLELIPSLSIREEKFHAWLVHLDPVPNSSQHSVALSWVWFIWNDSWKIRKDLKITALDLFLMELLVFWAEAECCIRKIFNSNSP